MPSAALEPLERLDPLRAAALGAQPVLVERQPRIALGELEDPPLVAALGVADLDRRAAPLGQRLGEQRVVGVAARDDHLRRDRQRSWRSTGATNSSSTSASSRSPAFSR